MRRHDRSLDELLKILGSVCCSRHLRITSGIVTLRKAYSGWRNSLTSGIHRQPPRAGGSNHHGLGVLEFASSTARNKDARNPLEAEALPLDPRDAYCSETASN
jgi:hypothetical protein